jgi:hypothetical protein
MSWRRGARGPRRSVRRCGGRGSLVPGDRALGAGKRRPSRSPITSGRASSSGSPGARASTRPPTPATPCAPVLPLRPQPAAPPSAPSWNRPFPQAGPQVHPPRQPVPGERGGAQRIVSGREMTKAKGCAVCRGPLGRGPLKLAQDGERAAFCSFECLIAFAVDRIRAARTPQPTGRRAAGGARRPWHSAGGQV